MVPVSSTMYPEGVDCTLDEGERFGDELDDEGSAGPSEEISSGGTDGGEETGERGGEPGGVDGTDEDVE